MKGTYAAFAVFAICALAPSFQTDVRAHHAFSAEFDANKPVKFTNAVVTRVQLINPHSWITSTSRARRQGRELGDRGGQPEHPDATRHHEGHSSRWAPRSLSTGYQAKDGTRRANGRDLTLPDGTKLFLGRRARGRRTKCSVRGWIRNSERSPFTVRGSRFPVLVLSP
jgi:hypothetical protein